MTVILHKPNVNPVVEWVKVPAGWPIAWWCTTCSSWNSSLRMSLGASNITGLATNKALCHELCIHQCFTSSEKTLLVNSKQGNLCTESYPARPFWSPSPKHVMLLFVRLQGLCKVVIWRGWDGATVYAGGWKLRVTDEWRSDGRMDGTYSAGLKDSASAYVLCPRLAEQWYLSIWKGVGITEKDLEIFRERWEAERSAGRQKR